MCYNAINILRGRFCAIRNRRRISVNVLVIGSGRLGRYLADMLDREGHDVALIDENEDNFRQLDKDFSGITVEGVPMDMEVLKRKHSFKHEMQQY